MLRARTVRSFRRERNRFPRRSLRDRHPKEIYTGGFMNGVIYLVGLIVVIMAILSFFGLH
jgi:hypothetical protein